MKKVLLLMAFAGLLGATAFAQRDPLLYPFVKTSIWNMPLHNNAKYVSAGINILGYFYNDDNQVILTPTAPMTNIQENTVGWGGGRCNVGGDGTVLDTVPIPANFVVNDVTTGGTPNNSAAILMPDTVTIHQNQPFQRCTAGTYAISQYNFPQDNIITGTGQRGAHGGSGMSSLGGTIRVGELVPGGVIHHALEMGLMSDFLDKANNGYRWPAVTADGNDSCYNSSNSNMLMGVLLALPPSFDVSSLSTQPARIIASALQNYGAYVVDTVACGPSWQGTIMTTENGPAGSAYTNFKNTWGYTFDGQGIDATHTANANPWIADMYNIVTHLQAVSNNDANDIGGGPTTDLTNRRVTTLCDPGTEGTGKWCNIVPVTTTTTSLVAAPASVPLNQPGSFTTTVKAASGTPTGSVIFKVGSHTFGKVALAAGKATLANVAITTANGFVQGADSVTANYMGSPLYAASNGSTTLTVTAPLPPTTAPAIKPAGGSFRAAQMVSITDAISGAAIYFTTDGSVPTTASAKYSAPFMLKASGLVKAIATAANHVQSPVTPATFTLIGSPAVMAAPATAIATTYATLNAMVNTMNLPASYQFLYGTKSSALTSSTTPATVATAANASALVSAQLPQLTLAAKTTYHFKVVVTTSGGSSSGDALSFTTN